LGVGGVKKTDAKRGAGKSPSWEKEGGRFPGGNREGGVPLVSPTKAKNRRPPNPICRRRAPTNKRKERTVRDDFKW